MKQVEKLTMELRDIKRLSKASPVYAIARFAEYGFGAMVFFSAAILLYLSARAVIDFLKIPSPFLDSTLFQTARIIAFLVMAICLLSSLFSAIAFFVLLIRGSKLADRIVRFHKYVSEIEARIAELQGLPLPEPQPNDNLPF